MKVSGETEAKQSIQSLADHLNKPHRSKPSMFDFACPASAYRPSLRCPLDFPIRPFLLVLGTEGLCGENCSLQSPKSLQPSALLECQHPSVFLSLIVTELSQLCIPSNWGALLVS
jgi:hypothetical protein